MDKVLRIIGLVWFALGAGNLILGFQRLSSSTVATFALIFNMVLFIIPGLILYAVGERMGKPKTPQPVYFVQYGPPPPPPPPPAMPPPSRPTFEA